MRGNLLLSLALYPDDAGQPAAILRLTLGSSLAMKLETTVRRLPCKLTEAFHNYFAVGNLTKCRVLGLENISFREYAAQPMKHGELPRRLWAAWTACTTVRTTREKSFWKIRS